MSTFSAWGRTKTVNPLEPLKTHVQSTGQALRRLHRGNKACSEAPKAKGAYHAQQHGVKTFSMNPLQGRALHHNTRGMFDHFKEGITNHQVPGQCMELRTRAWDFLIVRMRARSTSPGSARLQKMVRPPSLHTPWHANTSGKYVSSRVRP